MDGTVRSNIKIGTKVQVKDKDIMIIVDTTVEYEALDDEPVNLLFIIAANNDSGSAHIDILSKLSGMLMNEEFTSALKQAESPEEFLRIIDEAETKRDAKDRSIKESETERQISILAVTGCPTGIAHTFMAAESIEKAAKASGCRVKVETRGSGEHFSSSEDADSGIGHRIYIHLMNGVSHMLPFVVGGGILIAIAFLDRKSVV